MSNVEASIIIRTYNEAKHLPALLNALERQSNQDFEVIVVDSGSVDDTRSIAIARNANLIRIKKHDFTFGYSLNVGIRAAKGRFAVAVSAHTIPRDETWLENLIAPLRGEKMAMTYGRQLGVESSKYSECEDFRRIFGADALLLEPPHFFANNANAAIRRSLWEDYPFDEVLTGLEDIDWAKRWMVEGYHVAYVPNAALYHIHEETWHQVFNRYYREAVAIRHIGLKRRRNLPAELAREATWTISDLYRIFSGAENPAAKRLSLLQGVAEIFRFRLNKAKGTAYGILSAHPLETDVEREAILFDKTGVAVRITERGKATLQEVDIPQIKPGEVLIRVANVAVCATDLEILNGSLGYFKTGESSYPITPGHEFSGYTAAVGTNVNGLQEGTPVVVECIQSCGTCSECQAGNFIGCPERAEVGVMGRDGAYANYVSVPAKFVHPLPVGTDMRAAALVEPLAVCLKGYHRINHFISSSNRSLRWGVVGAGPIGHLFARLLEHKGIEPIVFDREPERIKHFDGSVIKGTTNLSKLANCDVVVEATGNPDALHSALHDSPAGASILLLGLPYGNKEFSFEAVAAYDKTVIGSVGSTSENFDEAISLLTLLRLERYFEHPMPLEKFDEAWRKSKQGEVLKVIMDVS